jgi:hypothetical protein
MPSRAEVRGFEADFRLHEVRTPPLDRDGGVAVWWRHGTPRRPLRLESPARHAEAAHMESTRSVRGAGSRDPVRSRWCALAFGACVLAVGLAYHELALPDALLGPGAYALAIAAALLGGFGGVGIARATLWAAASMPAVVVARVALDVAQDPASHNLLPVEIAIACGVGALYALPGAIAGRIAARGIAARTPRSEGKA